MTAPFAILACGNPSRGDDAIGPLLLEKLGGWLAAEGWLESFDLIEDFQFQIEHALDLQGRRAALFIDAGEGDGSPFTLAPVASTSPPSHSTHALSPDAVLDVYRRIIDPRPPSCHLLRVRGERFDLGATLSPVAAGHVEAAWPALQAWCRAAVGAGAGNGKP